MRNIHPPATMPPVKPSSPGPLRRSRKTGAVIIAANERTIAAARELAELPPEANMAYAGCDDPDDARAMVPGEAKALILELLAIIDRLGGED